MNPFAQYGYVQCISGTNLLNLEYYRSSRFSFHPVGAFLYLETLGQCSVNGDDFVAADQPGLHCRGVCIRLIYDDIAVFGLVYDCSDASISV